ncbi:MAG: ATP-binding protein [Planctomycetes bacterium]|nr:ATP-binding protein [Planctomycetota bacterium]
MTGIRGIRTRFALALLGAGLCITGVAERMLSSYIANALDDTLARRTRVHADLLLQQCNLATSLQEIERFVYASGSHREIIDLLLVGGTPARILGSTRRLLVGRTAAEAMAETSRLNHEGSLTPGARLDRGSGCYELATAVRFTNLNLPELYDRPGLILVHVDATSMLGEAEAVHRTLVIALLGVVAAAIGVFAALLRRQILRPVASLQRTMQARRDGDLLARPSPMPNAELQSLADSLADLLASLDRSRAMHRAIVEGASDAMIAIDVHGTIREWNGGAATLFGIPAEDAIGSDITRILPPEHAAAHDGYIRRYLGGAPPRIIGFPREVTAVRGDGTTVPIGLAVNEARVGDERLFVGILRDMTEEHAARRELQRAKNAADAAAAAKAAFLANMSHEIRTPLTAILGYAEELEREHATAAERAESTQVIRRNGEHLLTIVNDILDLSKIEAGRMTIERVPTRIDAIATEVITLMQPRAKQKGLTLDLVLASSMPEAIDTDPTRLRQILLNLVGNAIKFTVTGGVIVTIEASFTTGTIAIGVTDTGIGIPADKLPRLFGSFVQVDDSTARRFGGSGLGLHISKHLAQLLGGDLVAESLDGAGSRFTVTLACGPMQRAATGDRAAAVQLQTKRVQVPKLHGRVLLADDGPDNQRLLGRILGDTGLEVTVVADGMQAVAAATARPFDVVVMDVQMPVMDGLTATRTLRAAGVTTPIVALTANAMAEDRERARAAGCSHFATKPIDRRALYATLLDALPKSD